MAFHHIFRHKNVKGRCLQRKQSIYANLRVFFSFTFCKLLFRLIFNCWVMSCIYNNIRLYNFYLFPRWNFLLLLSVCSAVPSGEDDYRSQGKQQKLQHKQKRWLCPILALEGPLSGMFWSFLCSNTPGLNE